MKNNFVMLLCAALISITSCAQKENKIPAVVKEAFAREFPGVTKIKWDKEDSKYEAGFTQNNNNMSAVFSAEGKLEETEITIALSDLPPAALQYATAKGKIKEAAKIIKADGTVVFEAEVNGKDLLFDTAGNIIK